MNAIPTRAVQPGKNQYGSVQFPIYLNAAYSYSNPGSLENVFQGREFGYVYSRIQNPTVAALEERINALHNGNGAAATVTGMAAITGTLLTLLKSDDRILCSNTVFGGTTALLEQTLGKFNIQVVPVSIHDTAAIERYLAEGVKLLFAETLGNPALDIPDIPLLSELCRKYGTPFVLDATMTPPGLIDLKRWPVSLVVHSTTKFICGNGSVLGGAVIDLGNFDWSSFDEPLIIRNTSLYGADRAFLAAFRTHALQNGGLTQQPFAAFNTMQGSETLIPRLKMQTANAFALAEHLSGKHQIDRVNYPGLPDNVFYSRATELFDSGFPSLLTIDLGSKEKAFLLAEGLNLVRNMTNLGDSRTLVVHPESTIFINSSDEQKKNAGVTAGLLRISVGLESTEDLIADFDQALEKL